MNWGTQFQYFHWKLNDELTMNNKSLWRICSIFQWLLISMHPFQLILEFIHQRDALMIKMTQFEIASMIEKSLTLMPIKPKLSQEFRCNVEETRGPIWEWKEDCIGCCTCKTIYSLWYARRPLQLASFVCSWLAALRTLTEWILGILHGTGRPQLVLQVRVSSLKWIKYFYQNLASISFETNISLISG